VFDTIHLITGIDSEEPTGQLVKLTPGIDEDVIIRSDGILRFSKI